MHDYPYEKLERRHQAIEDTLWDMVAEDRIGTDNWARLRKREEELRMERLRRLMQRERPE